MAKVKVTIEETVSEEFAIEIPDGVNQDEYITQMYKNGKLVLEPGNLVSSQYMTEDETGFTSSWVEIQ